MAQRVTTQQAIRNINAMIIPTGIGASIGGYAGDAIPACKLLAKTSDLLITHPNVVNAALLSDIPENVVVVEGYLLDRFFAGQVALRTNVKHKIAVVVDKDAAERTTEKEITQNCMNAAKHVYGLDIMPEIYVTEDSMEVTLQKVGNQFTLFDACKKAVDDGATALAVLANIPDDPESTASKAYEAGTGYDPIGKIESRISHMVCREFLIPAAHAPILEPGFEHSGIVAPRVAAEHLGLSYLTSVFKCLQASAQIIPISDAYLVLQKSSAGYLNPEELVKKNNLRIRHDDIVIQDLANLVVPYDACNGTPMVEALNHDIQVICVENNHTNLEDTADLYLIRYTPVKNYLEAAGHLLCNTKDKSYIDASTML